MQRNEERAGNLIGNRRGVTTAIGVMAAITTIGALAGCARGNDVVSSATSDAPTTVVESTTTTEPAPTTSTSTSTSTSTTTAVPTTTSSPTTTVVEPPAGERPVTAFVTAGADLLEVDVATGNTIRVVAEYFDGDGVFRGGLRLTGDRSAMWFSEGYEDSWYGCESSVGSYGLLDLEAGTDEVFGGGSSPEPSADGEFVAYLASELCLPDPEAPDFWVLTPYDRVVVQQVESGETREFVTNAPPDAYGAPGAIEGAVFSPAGNLLVLMGDGQLRNVDLDGSGVLQDHPVVVPDVVGAPVGALNDALLTVVFGDEGSSDLFSIDTVTGATTLLASSEAFMAVGVSASGRIVAASSDVITVAPGADVLVLAVNTDAFVFALDW